ncbi:hypothetical protein [Propionivibrio sp.]|uniref:hypothetical protein n=1 Tax=Propionivibrio sp. TaxID=2212460 RepID=UPI003BF06F70
MAAPDYMPAGAGTGTPASSKPPLDQGRTTKKPNFFCKGKRRLPGRDETISGVTNKHRKYFMADRIEILTTRIEDELRPVLKTPVASAYLGIRGATMREWADKGTGPLQPLRFNKRALLWKTSDIKKLLGVAA